MNKKRLSNAGFTLIELLIVIVIIGILAGVVIGVLNPIQQQNRAKDGTLRSSLSKMSLSAKSLYVSATRSTDRAPTPAEFIQGLGSVLAEDCTTVSNATDPTQTSIECSFTLTGVGLPEDCDPATAYNGTGGTAACEFRYWRSQESFQIAARGFADPVQVFVYAFNADTDPDNPVDAFYQCPLDFDITDDATDLTGTGPGCSVVQ